MAWSLKAWQKHVALSLLVRLAIIIALLPFAIDWRSPLLTGLRPAALAALIVVPLLLIAIDGWMLRLPQSRMRRALSVAVLLAAGATLVATLAQEARFQWIRARVLAADAAQLEKLGRHFVVGYRDVAEIERLIARRAIGGVFVGARNVEGRSAEAIRAQIEGWQETRRRQGLPPLLIATDQEGGAVSRLSPPLPRQPPIASVAAHHAGDEARNTAAACADEPASGECPARAPNERPRRPPASLASAAYAYGATQGRALADAGINLNFAPVVDLNKNLVNPNDRHTRIRERAISGDPAVVVEVARYYCRGLREAGVHCTLKHFPGLGGVFEDTHLEAGHLHASLATLESGDWIPFRSLMSDGTFTMLSHAKLTVLDAERPVSFSPAVVSGLLRGTWGYDGVLITDDFSMGAVYGAKEGVAAASIAALDAGVDLVLIAYDPAQYFPMMDAVLAAYRDGSLRPAVLAQSARRLASIASGQPGHF